MRTVKALTAVLMKIQVFLNIQHSSGRATDIYAKTYCLRIQGSQRRLSRRWKQQTSTKYLYPFTDLHGVMFEDTFNIIPHVSVRF
jgi:hypothetical protein